MTSAHFATWASMKSLNCGCVITTGVAPVFSHATLILGRERIFVISRLSVSIIGCGVPAGAMNPTHKVAWNPGTPASAMVGTSGRIAERVAPLVPSARTLPALIIGAMVGTLSN